MMSKGADFQYSLRLITPHLVASHGTFKEMVGLGWFKGSLQDFRDVDPNKKNK